MTIFSDLVKDSCQKDVRQIDRGHPILKLLSKGLDGILKKSAYTRYEDRRINDLGKSLETEIKSIIENSSECKIIPYSQHMGYPDLRLEINDDIVFIEIKTTSKDENFSSTQRVFYFTNGNKITSNGYHILVQLFLEPSPNNPNSYQFKKWKIKDLHSLNINLKQEYNASYKDLHELPTLFCSS